MGSSVSDEVLLEAKEKLNYLFSLDPTMQALVSAMIRPAMADLVGLYIAKGLLDPATSDDEALAVLTMSVVHTVNCSMPLIQQAVAEGYRPEKVR